MFICFSTREIKETTWLRSVCSASISREGRAHYGDVSCRDLLKMKRPSAAVASGLHPRPLKSAPPVLASFTSRNVGGRVTTRAPPREGAKKGNCARGGTCPDGSFRAN